MKRSSFIPRLPRFVRQGDSLILNAKVSNLSGDLIESKVSIELKDLFKKTDWSDQILGNTEVNRLVTLQAGESQNVEWAIEIPENFNSALEVAMKIQGNNFTDGEVNVLPVLSNRMLVTETKAFSVKPEMLKTIEFEALLKMHNSTSLINQGYSMELTTNPNWLILKSLPYLLDSQGESTNEIVETLYASLLADNLIQINPSIRTVLQQWAKEYELQSPLSKNQDLKLAQLDETPWIRDAIAEEENMKALSKFLDKNHVDNSLRLLTEKLRKRQQINGGFSWYPGGRDNWYITQYILEILGKLQSHNISINNDQKILTKKAVHYCDQRLLEFYDDINKDDLDYIDSRIVHYMYMRSFYRDVPIPNNVYPAFNFFKNLGKKSWTKSNSYLQALLAIAFDKWNEKEAAQAIILSLKQRMIEDEELGHYWNDQAGYYWFNSDIEKHATMIELFDHVGNNEDVVDGLKLWLLRHKQVNSWKTSKASASAVHAFMLNREKNLHENHPVKVLIHDSKTEVEFLNQEIATGYSRKNWNASEVDSKLASIQVQNPNKNLIWGGMYWQYFEDLDKITSHDDNPLKINKSIYRLSYDGQGFNAEVLSDDIRLTAGNKLRIKLELKVDRPMEFLVMKDMRGSGLEPVNVISRYRYQDGLSYYESTKDQASYFYFENVAKGNYVFEYDLIVRHKGKYSNGICQIQSYYAPEFGSHSNGYTLEIVDR